MVGLRNAMAIALLGDTFDAAEALRLGLVNRVVPAATLEEETDSLARRLAEGPTLAIGRMKRLLRQSLHNDLGTQLDLERDNFRASAGTEDFGEALSAFFARRPPHFRGR
jgi:2-(1,2-epoxy-1,2-dihydrophenyl)acetyl-CoA isomerase